MSEKTDMNELEEIDYEKGCFWCSHAIYTCKKSAPFPPRPYVREVALYCLIQRRFKKNFDLCDRFEDFRVDEQIKEGE